MIIRGAILGTLVTVGVILVDRAGGLAMLNARLYDLRAAWCQPDRKGESNYVVHVDIDDAALESYGKPPWPRNVYADVVDELSRSKAKVIAFDMTMPDPEDVAGTGNANHRAGSRRNGGGRTPGCAAACSPGRPRSSSRGGSCRGYGSA